MIKYIPQPTISTCGQASIAMLANSTVEEAIKRMKNDSSTECEDIINGLRAFGIKCDDEFVKITEENPRYPEVSILLVWFPSYGHWVVHYHGKFYDPEFGLLDQCVSHGRIGSYLSVYLNEGDENQ